MVRTVLRVQEDLDEEEYPEGFKLVGAVPQAQQDSGQQQEEALAGNLPSHQKQTRMLCIIFKNSTSYSKIHSMLFGRLSYARTSGGDPWAS